MNLSKLKMLVDKSGYKKREFCRLIGITTPTFYAQINSNDMKVSTLEKICRLLDVSPLEFFELEKDDEKSMAAEPVAGYTVKKDIHIGKLIEKRLNAIGMTAAEFGRLIGTTRQNAVGILKRKSITWEHAIRYNEVLNPVGSKPWDIFEHFLRIKPETREEKYLRLLEDYNRLVKRQKNASNVNT